MSADLLAAAVKLDDAARFRLVAGFTVARDSAAANGDAALAEFYSEVAAVLADLQQTARAERVTLEDDFTRVIGVEVGPVEFGDDDGVA